jgi:hypothetical protein
MQNMELVRTFRKFGVTLRLYEMAYSLSEGKTRCAYELKHGRKVIFEGKEFYTGAGFTADSMRSVECLLGFLTLQIGDTDREYFDNYTERSLSLSIQIQRITCAYGCTKGKTRVSWPKDQKTIQRGKICKTSKS